MRREMVGLYKHNAEEKIDCNTSASTEIDTYVSDLDLTHEEEFRMYELLVRREHLVDGIFEISLQYPHFLDTWKELSEYSHPRIQELLQ